MSAEDDPKRPLPSAEEINAYLELSAARTKKRLTLAAGSIGAPKRPGGDRKLPVARANKPLPVTAGSNRTESNRTESNRTEADTSPEPEPAPKSKPSGD